MHPGQGVAWQASRGLGFVTTTIPLALPVSHAVLPSPLRANRCKSMMQICGKVYRMWQNQQPGAVTSIPRLISQTTSWKEAACRIVTFYVTTHFV